MTIRFRQYDHPLDYKLVDQFLIHHYQPGNADRNWVEPAWEYMHFHPMLDSTSLDKIGIWEEAGKIVAVAHYESHLGEAFFQFDPAYRHLRQEMLEHAERSLRGRSRQDGRKLVYAYVNDSDQEFVSLLRARGYEKDVEEARPVARFEIPEPFPSITLPKGFRLTSLADDCDWAKVDRVLWRGFGNPGKPATTAEDIRDRQRMFDTPKARLDLKIAVEAPDSEFASFSGAFYEPAGRYAYVEPVATDPAYRRMGLGKAAVLEGIRRCGTLGARVAYVGSDQPFYLSLGFRVIYNNECWVKFFE